MSLRKGFFWKPEGSAESVPGSEPMDIGKRRQRAFLEVLGIFQEHFQTTFESHPASVLYAGAWLAGTSLYRSFGYTLEAEPGTPVLSDKANEQGPKLVDLYFYALIEKSHVKLDTGNISVEIPPEHKPKMDILKVQELFQDSYNQIMKKNGFDYVQGAQIGAFICAILTETHCVRQKDLELGLAAGIVVKGFVEGVKTCPLPLKTGN